MNEAKLTEIIRRSEYWNEEENGYFTYYITPSSYDDELSEDKCADILEEDNPINALEDYLAYCADENVFSYYGVDLWSSIQNDPEYDEYFSDEDESEILDFVREHTSFIMRKEDWNRDICLNIAVDTGDADYDYTKNNILNYDGNGEIEEESSILWLAKQQGREQDFRNTIKNYPVFCETLDQRTEEKRLEKADITHKYYSAQTNADREKYLNIQKRLVKEIAEIENEVKAEFGYDSFILSVIEELENLPSSIGMLTFCIKTTLLDAIKIKQADKVIISKKATCGLFDDWNGGGSLLEIQLDKDVEIPVENIGKMWIDLSHSSKYNSIHSVYGTTDSLWNRGELKIERKQNESNNRRSGRQLSHRHRNRTYYRKENRQWRNRRGIIRKSISISKKSAVL